MPHCDIRLPVAVVAEPASAGNRTKTNSPSIGLSGVAALLAALSSLLVVFLFSAQDAADAAAVCNKYAKTNGSAQKLVDSLRPGQVGCLRGGTYTDRDGQLSINKSGVTLRSAPGTRATLNARIFVPESGDRVTVSGLTIKGTKGKASVLIRGNYTKWLGNNVTNGRRSDGCFHLGSLDRFPSAGTVISGNAIHSCGNHGIYVSKSSQARITNNRIYSNTENGIQLYPNSQRTLVEGNTIHHNGQGLIFNGNSSGNVVRGNLIYYSARDNINAPRAARGSNNLVERNCLQARGGGSGVNPNPRVFTVRNNVVAVPGSALCRSVL